jgi:hypothetical protein
VNCLIKVQDSYFNGSKLTDSQSSKRHDFREERSSSNAAVSNMTKPAAANTLLWLAQSFVLTCDANDLYSRLNWRVREFTKKKYVILPKNNRITKDSVVPHWLVW